MASSVTNSSAVLEAKLQWYAIRDMLLETQSWTTREVKRLLKFAAVCTYPDARWLAEVFAGKDVTTKEQARKAFLEQGENDARALCFAALLGESFFDEPRMRRSAELGFAFAQACIAEQKKGVEQECFKFSMQAASQEERDGFFQLGSCYQDGIGCVKDLNKAKENYLLGAQLGSVRSMLGYGWLLDQSDPQLWHWWGLAAHQGSARFFLNSFSKQVELFNSDSSLAPVVFAIGRALKGHVRTKSREIFCDPDKYDSLIDPAKQAISFFSFQVSAARKAVDAWCIVAFRVGNGRVSRDIRRKIGLFIWEARELAEYKLI